MFQELRREREQEPESESDGEDSGDDRYVDKLKVQVGNDQEMAQSERHSHAIRKTFPLKQKKKEKKRK